MKVCSECGGCVSLYVDGATGKPNGWYCRECIKKYADDEVEQLDGEYDELSMERMALIEKGQGA